MRCSIKPTAQRGPKKSVILSEVAGFFTVEFSSRLAPPKPALFALLVVLVTFVLNGCSKTPSATTLPVSELTFYWTCDAHGRLEPCGCFTGQHGGLTRVSTLLNSADLGEGLLADAGNSIAGPADYQVIQYRYMQRAFASMGYVAVNVGEREAQLSADDLRKLRDSPEIPGVLLSANLLDRATGQRLFPAYRIVQSHGIRVAYLGVLGDVPEENLGTELTVEPAKSALAKILPEVKRQADVIVLLAYADEPTMRALADQFYELDLILGGKVKQPSQQLTQQNRSVVLWTTNETKALGMLKARVGGPSRFTAEDFNIHFVDEKIPQDSKLVRYVQDYRDEIRKTSLGVDDPGRLHDDEVPGVKPAAGYVGSESCAPCHATAYKTWEQSGHASAFRSLVARQSEADPNCIGCHSVGFGTPTGYRREYAGKKLVNVGCESCHGPGSEHVSEARLAQTSGAAQLYQFRPLGAADCTSCHYGEFSRPFNWETFWPRVRHGKEPPLQFRRSGPAPIRGSVTMTTTHP